MDPVFCCSEIAPCNARIIDREASFKLFVNWANSLNETSKISSGFTPDISWDSDSTYVIQVARQVNFGALEWKRYFVIVTALVGTSTFFEVKEQDLIDAEYSKVNAFQNFRCGPHNKLFEINMYQKDPTNNHHWRVNNTRPIMGINI